jgi:hypothetical protein
MTDGFWRVYRAEWTVAYISDADGEEGTRECMQKFMAAYEGRVQPGEWRVVAWSESDPAGWPVMLEVRLPVMKGEYRDEQDARGHASEVDGTVVRENSGEEIAMLRHAALMTQEDSG